jgi:hypothetical protein
MQRKTDKTANRTPSLRSVGGLRPYTRPGKISTSTLGRSEPYRETDSGAVITGSNPAGGTGQRHKFEHSNNLERLQCQRCDLRKRGRVPDLAPYTCPTAKGLTGELPAQQHHTLTVSWPKTGRCSCADTVACDGDSTGQSSDSPPTAGTAVGTTGDGERRVRGTAVA